MRNAAVSADALPAVLFDHLPQFVEGAQKQIRDVGIRYQLARTNQVEHGLGLVGQFLDPGQAEKAARPLDGMSRPKDLVDQVLVDVAAGFLNGKQIGFYGRQMFT